MPKHTLHVIGVISDKRCYLDVPLEEAKRRYLEDTRSYPGEAIELDETLVRVKTFEFDDAFGGYDVWPLHK